MLRMNGPLRITVLDKDAYFEQRAVVRTPYGTQVLEGRIGASLDVRADEWELELQHCVPGVGWRPNVRVLPYPWQTSGGLRSRIVRSKDCDWPQGDPTERNFVLRLSASVAERPLAAPSVADAVGPATRGGLRTSSGGADFGTGVRPGVGSVPAVTPGTTVPAVPAAPVTGVPLSGTRVGEALHGAPVEAVRAEAGRLPTGRVTPAVWPAPTPRTVPAEGPAPAPGTEEWARTW